MLVNTAFVLRKIQITSVGAAPVRNVNTADIIYGKLPDGCFSLIVTNIRCQKKNNQIYSKCQGMPLIPF